MARVREASSPDTWNSVIATRAVVGYCVSGWTGIGGGAGAGASGFGTAGAVGAAGGTTAFGVGGGAGCGGTAAVGSGALAAGSAARSPFGAAPGAEPARGTAGVVKELERRQKSRATRTERDVLDRALVDLSGFYRDVIACTLGSAAPLMNPDVVGDVQVAASRLGAVGALHRLDAVLACREAIELNVKPQIAVEAMMMALYAGPVSV